MSVLSYLDFDFEVVKHDSRYRGRVLSSPAGQAVHDFAVPFTSLELENFFLRVGRARRGTRRIGSPEMDAARTYGRRLFESVFGGEVNACFRSALNEASRQGKGLRIRLRLTEAPELGDLAWEYLCNPALGRFLSLSVDTPLVRYLELPEPIRPIAIATPLRILVAIASPSDHPPLDVNREWRKLKEALGDLEQKGLVALEELSEGTLAALQKRLRHEECHVFHFIGHGGFNPQSQDGTLIFEDASGKGHAVNGEYLGTLLHDHRPLRLALLNACEGARTSVNDPFAGVAQTLVQQGVPAVIAMQFEITDEAAITLAHEFYGAIADGYPVDGALAEARKAIFAQGNDIEWGTPVLYMRAPDGQIFTIAPPETRAAEPPREARPEPVIPTPDAAPVEPPQGEPASPATATSAAGRAASTRRLPIVKVLIPVALVALVATLLVPSLYRGVFPPWSSLPPGLASRPSPDSPSKAIVPQSAKALRDRAGSGDADALVALRRMAEAGDADAQYLLGELLLLGEGVPKNAAEGTSWIKKAAAQGQPNAVARDKAAVTPPVARRNPRCTDLLEKLSLGVALSADERTILNRDCN